MPFRIVADGRDRKVELPESVFKKSVIVEGDETDRLITLVRALDFAE